MKCHICKMLIGKDNRFFDYLCIKCAEKALHATEKEMQKIMGDKIVEK